ncbi:hypothetical protein [Acinetobacter guillouiae]|uniref:hypothetical protein n=1 Tax=Acinetobacter guillouiae TaxID=106649 RepID=UPI0012506DB5|nr:hypothetical protein [Acinetobacter guillouiae]
MKKIILFSLVLISNICSAEVIFDTDDELTNLGIIDENYKYVDLKKATWYFKTITNNMASMIPVKLNQHIEIADVFFSPFYAATSYRLTNDLDQNRLEAFKLDILSNEQLDELCKISFQFKFFYANDFKYEIFYKTIDDKILAKVILDKRKCKIKNE